MTKKRILAVDDNKDALKLLSVMLESMGHEVVSYSDPEVALAEISAWTNGTTVDLALLDIMMPKMTGFELLAELKKISAFESVPVIMVTAKDSDGDILDGYQHGADYYITKPYTTQQLKYGLDLYL